MSVSAEHNPVVVEHTARVPVSSWGLLVVIDLYLWPRELVFLFDADAFLFFLSFFVLSLFHLLIICVKASISILNDVSLTDHQTLGSHNLLLLLVLLLVDPRSLLGGSYSLLPYLLWAHGVGSSVECGVEVGLRLVQSVFLHSERRLGVLEGVLGSVHLHRMILDWGVAFLLLLVIIVSVQNFDKSRFGLEN